MDSIVTSFVHWWLESYFILPLTLSQLIQWIVHYTMWMNIHLACSHSQPQPHWQSLFSTSVNRPHHFQWNTVFFHAHTVALYSEMTVLTGQRHLADSYGNCEHTHTHTPNILWIFFYTAPIRSECNSWQTHFTPICLCFPMFSHILFSRAESLCGDNEVASIIVVAELFTRDFGYNETLVISFCIRISKLHKSTVV